MIEFIGEFLSAHYWTISYALTYTLGTICGLALITRFVRMFPTYIKTGSMGNDKLGIFFTNRDYEKIGGMDYIKAKVKDFFTATHLETIFFDLIVCGMIIVVLHIGWILLVIVGLIGGSIYSIITFMQYLRGQHVKKENFHDALRGD